MDWSRQRNGSPPRCRIWTTANPEHPRWPPIRRRRALRAGSPPWAPPWPASWSNRRQGWQPPLNSWPTWQQVSPPATRPTRSKSPASTPPVRAPPCRAGRPRRHQSSRRASSAGCTTRRARRDHLQCGALRRPASGEAFISGWRQVAGSARDASAAVRLVADSLLTAGIARWPPTWCAGT